MTEIITHTSDPRIARKDRLNHDLRAAAARMGNQQARFLVDAYYTMQDDRKRSYSQERATLASGEPHLVISWLAVNAETLEEDIRRLLGEYADTHPVGKWLRTITGIGPVIAAGLLAHIDINKAPTAGHIWKFAGLDPEVKWEKGQKRPWNAKLKTLCWKIGQSFMKFSGNPNCMYGHIYRQRKEYEIARNEAGGNAETAKAILATNRFGKQTEAYKAYIKGKLPAGQIDARARRYAVKILLSHLQMVWYFHEKGELPNPFNTDLPNGGGLGTAFDISPMNTEMFPGLTEAIANAKH